MALIHHYTRADGERYETRTAEAKSPAEYIIANIPSGVPFACYRSEIADSNDVTNNVDAMLGDGEFHIVESAGGGVGKFIGKIFKPVLKLFGLDMSAPDIKIPNQQAESANNSLTDRNNKPRPYDRVYDICGTVQSIPSDLMDGYYRFDSRNREFGFNYYYIGRSYLDTPSSGITDGDTLLSSITGSSAAIYDPFTSPNNSAPRQVIGDTITEGLYISARSNEIDGITLRAPNELVATVIDGAIASLSGVSGTITDNSADAGFDSLFKVGDVVALANFKVAYTSGGQNLEAVLDGSFAVQSVDEKFITMDVSSALVSWQAIPSGSAPIKTGQKPTISPTAAGAGYTDWVTISKIKPERLLINIVAGNGLYKDNEDGRLTASVSAQVQYQLLDAGLNPIDSILSQSQTLSDKTGDEVGMSIIITLPYKSAVRVRVRRSSDKDFKFKGSVTDEVKFRDLYGQIQDHTPHYGDMTTIHTVRKNTSQATAVKQPQLKVMATEMLYKYLGGGIFDSVRTPNTQAAQSLIRLMNDPLVGGLTLTAANMDRLIASQAEIETYFGNAQAGQFCYTFDDANETAQDIANMIAAAIFCTIDRANNQGEIRLAFERPQAGPALVFTHRSKIGAEKWDTAFSSGKKYDSVELSYVDPTTNIKEVIKIPPEGGARPNKVDFKGIRNKYQATLMANRIRQKDKLKRVTVDVTTTEEGIYAVAGEAISVVKGTRIATYDGYIVKQDGLTLTLSQEVEFTDGDQHSIILKRRDGSAESIDVEPSPVNARTVLMLSSPLEPIYTGNSATKTEFSFGNEARHLAQMIVPATVEPSGRTVKITGYNYDPDYYLYDMATVSGGFSNGFSDGFSNQ